MMSREGTRMICSKSVGRSKLSWVAPEFEMARRNSLTVSSSSWVGMGPSIKDRRAPLPVQLSSHKLVFSPYFTIHRHPFFKDFLGCSHGFPCDRSFRVATMRFQKIFFSQSHSPRSSSVVDKSPAKFREIGKVKSFAFFNPETPLINWFGDSLPVYAMKFTF